MPSGFFASTPALTVNTSAPPTSTSAESSSPPTSPYIGSLPRPGTSIIPRSSTEQRRTSLERRTSNGMNGVKHDDELDDVDETILSGSGPSITAAPLSSSATVSGGMKKSSSTPVLYTLDTEEEGVPNLTLQPSMGTVPITRTVSTPYPQSTSSSTSSSITSSTSSLSSTSTPATSSSMTLVSSNTQPSTQIAQASPQVVPFSSSYAPSTSSSSSSSSSSSTSTSSTTSSSSIRRSSSSHHFRFHLSEKDDSITAPLYVLVEELFALNTRGWMRRQATWVGKQIVKMSFNSAISTWINDSVAYFTSDEQVVANIDWIIDLIWPGGTLRSAGVAPTPEECESTAAQARAILLGSVPSSIRTLLGPKHCDESMRKFFDFLQMEPLVQHFAYSVLDTLVLEMFPELHKDLKS